MQFFTGNIKQTEKDLTGYLYWSDYKHSTESVRMVRSKNEYVAWFISEQGTVIKSIVKRYCSQQLERLSKSELASVANDLKVYVGDLKKAQSTGSVCAWVKKHEHRLIKILPDNHDWAKIIPALINHAKDFNPTTEFDKAVEIVKKPQLT